MPHTPNTNKRIVNILDEVAPFGARELARVRAWMEAAAGPPCCYHWLGAVECTPPHGVTHPDRVNALADSLALEGWRDGEPALIGYPFGARVQLISGSHRYAACAKLKIPMPVLVLPYAFVRAIWGTDAWLALVHNPPTVERT